MERPLSLRCAARMLVLTLWLPSFTPTIDAGRYAASEDHQNWDGGKARVNLPVAPFWCGGAAAGLICDTHCHQRVARRVIICGRTPRPSLLWADLGDAEVPCTLALTLAI